MMDFIKKNVDNLDFDAAIVITCLFWLFMILFISKIGYWIRDQLSKKQSPVEIIVECSEHGSLISEIFALYSEGQWQGNWNNSD